MKQGDMMFNSSRIERNSGNIEHVYVDLSELDSDTQIQKSYPSQLHAKAKLFIKTLVDDFFGELNYLIGFVNHRHEVRKEMMGKMATAFYASIPRPSLFPFDNFYNTRNHPSQYEHIHEAALLFVRAWESSPDQWKSFDNEEIEQIAISGVDRILEYVTRPNDKDELCTWSMSHYLKGLVKGDGRRWAMGLSSTESSNRIQEFYTLTNVGRVDAWSEDYSRAYGRNRRRVSSQDLGATNIDDTLQSKPSEASKDLHSYVKQWTLDFQNYIFSNESEYSFCLMSKISENRPEPNKLYLIITDKQIKYRTNLTPGSDYVALGRNMSHQHEELSECNRVYMLPDGASIPKKVEPQLIVIRKTPQLSNLENSANNDSERDNQHYTAYWSKGDEQKQGAFFASDLDYMLLPSLGRESEHRPLIEKVASICGETPLYRAIQQDKLAELGKAHKKALLDETSGRGYSRADSSVEQQMLADIKARLHRMRCRDVDFPLGYAEINFSLQGFVYTYPNHFPILNTDARKESLREFIKSSIRPTSNTTWPQFLTTQHGLLRVDKHYEVDAQNDIWSYLQSISLDNSQKGYVPIRIYIPDLTRLKLKFTAPLLPQYFEKVLGYTKNGVQHLKNHYRFFFLFVGLNNFDSPDQVTPSEFQDMLNRLYWGEETADWTASKVLFIASKDFKAPVRQQVVAVQEARLPLIFSESGLEYWSYHVLDQQQSIWFNENLHKLTPLVKPFDKQDTISPASDVKHGNKASIVLVNIVALLIRHLQEQPEENWPKNRYQLFEFALRSEFKQRYASIYRKLQYIALELFRHKCLAWEEVDPKFPLEAWPFVTTTTTTKVNGNQISYHYRYTFKHVSLRDHLIAEALWQSLYEIDVAPETYLWNHVELTKEYPWVMYFLTERLEHSPTRSIDEKFLQRRWVDNGALFGWESVYKNARDLLEACRLGDKHRETSNATPTASIKYSLIDKAKETAMQQFVCVRPHWQPRFVERFDRNNDVACAAAFGALGHGGGISTASPVHNTDNSSIFHTGSRYIYVNSSDQYIGQILINKAYAAIESGSKEGYEELQILVPNSWGFYKRDTQLAISHKCNEKDVLEAEIEYLAKLQQEVFTYNGKISEQVADVDKRLEKFRLQQEPAWLSAKLKAYAETPSNMGSYSPQGKSAKPSKKDVTKHAGTYRQKLQEKLINHREALKDFLLGINAASDRLPNYFDGIITCLEKQIDQCDLKIKSLITNEADLMKGMRERFIKLMNAFKESQEQIPNDAIINQEIEQGGEKLVERFKAAFREVSCRRIQEQCQESVAHEMPAQFLKLMGTETPENPMLLSEWPNVQQQWQAAETPRKDSILALIKEGDLDVAMVKLKLTIRPRTVASEDFYEALSALLEHNRKHAIEEALHQFFVQQPVATNIRWEASSLEEKEAVRQAFCDLLDQKIHTEIAKNNFLLIFKQYPELVLLPTDEYIMRYLRFGLSVDACLEERTDKLFIKGDTLLFYAIKHLAELQELQEIQSKEKSRFAFRIVKYLINVGASVNVCNQAEGINKKLNTPKGFVTELGDYRENERWQKIKKAIETIIPWEITAKNEDDIFSELFVFDKKVDDYAEILHPESRFSLDGISAMLRSSSLRSDREESIKLYRPKFEKICGNRFDLLERLDKLQTMAHDGGERRVFTGRLHGRIYAHANACLQVLRNQQEKINPGYSGEIQKIVSQHSLFNKALAIFRVSPSASSDSAVEISHLKQELNESIRELGELKRETLQEREGRLRAEHGKRQAEQEALRERELRLGSDQTINQSLPESPHELPRSTSSTKPASIATFLESRNLPGLNFVTIEGDGNCLYNAIDLHIGKDATLIRKMVANHLEYYREEYEPVVNALLLPRQTFENYIDGVRGREWGDDLELAVIMRALDRAILVVHPDGRIEHGDAVDTYEGDPIFVYYNGIDHYNGYARNSNLSGRQIFAMLEPRNEHIPVGAINSEAEVVRINSSMFSPGNRMG